MNKIVSIIMPTLNSEKTIRKSFESIHKQNFDFGKIEVLVIDGGSTDKTLEIALEFGGKIIPNPKRLPEAAKEIGLIEGCGKYGIFMDSDESFINPDSISGRIKIFEENSKVKNVVSQGIIAPKGKNGILQYMNFTGDPFSYFIYRINGFDRSKSYKKTYDYEDKGSYYVFNFKEDDILPIIDSAIHMFDLEFAQSQYLVSNDKSNYVSTLFDSMVHDTLSIGMLKDDCIFHIPLSQLSNYMVKLKWRVLNNLFRPANAGVGFSARSTSNRKLSNRRFLFLVYCLSIIWPLYDSIYLSVKNKSIVFMIHFILVYYVIFNILYYSIKKCFGYRPQSISYSNS